MSLSEFHDVQLPMAFAFGASGGPERRTDIVALASGGEARNATWSGSRRRWDLASAVSTLADLQGLTHFFEARRGRLHGFRFRDQVDDRSSAYREAVSAEDQALGIGDGTQTIFPLTKDYAGYSRRILKPVSGSVRVAIDGVEVSSGLVVNTALGEVRFVEPPAEGAVLTAGFLFDVPVRFDTDRLDVAIEAFGAGRAASVPIVELIG